MISDLTSGLRLLRGSFTPLLVPCWGSDERRALDRWFEGERFSAAPRRLEADAATWLGGGAYVRALNSGRSALQVAIEAFDLPPGSEIAAPAFACGSMAAPIIRAGHLPVFVDTDDHYNISIDSLRTQERPRLRAVVVPHLAGCAAADAEEIRAWADAHDALVLEDCAQAFGLKIRGRPVGRLGDAAIFSCGLGKPIFGPGGGWVATFEKRLAAAIEQRALEPESPARVDHRVNAFIDRYGGTPSEQSRWLLRHAVARKVRFRSVKPASPMESAPDPVHAISGIDAELARLQVSHIDELVGQCRAWGSRWLERWKALDIDFLSFPPTEGNIFNKFLASPTGPAGGATAKEICRALWRNGVEIEAGYTPLPLRAEFAGYRASPFPLTSSYWRQTFGIPTRSNLRPQDWNRIDAAMDELSTTFGKGRP